jgi:colanic acid/amylovoran biosynthesis glycosyltransferase
MAVTRTERRRTAAPAEGSSTRVLDVIGTYPLLTTTFIDREIEALRRRGVDVRVVAVRRPPEHPPLSVGQRRLGEDVTYLLPVGPATLIRAHAGFLARRPLRYLGTLALLLTRPHPDLRARMKTLLHFGEGVLLAHVVRHRRFDELHAHFIDRAATLALVASRLLDTTFSLSVHAGADLFVAPILIPEKVREARRIVTCTEHNRDTLVGLGGAEALAKTSVVHHGLALGDYVPRARPPDDPPVVLAVGQLVERKGFATLIRACATLRDRGLAFRCVIVGHGPQREELTASIRERSLDDLVMLAGALPHDEVVRLAGRASMSVLPCVRTDGGDVDGIPNALVEAMALELPVISSELPAIEELLGDEAGVLVPPGDDLALADAMEALLADPGRALALARRGRHAAIEACDLERNIDLLARTLWPERLGAGAPGSVRSDSGGGS